ncbi:putative codeine 3-O-demethylase [Rosa chinensis]|uniref:Putative codeine 3-O-demethylase n=1 Tax=Rosa chinensis TaxID=74649 RepID=A0A2P6RIN4_ROSCH|nr:protein SRG1 [Rosa chinensis]PRQ46271.1 putative codeine 3-O-demethylase [Rosa chinensis]
MAESSTPAKAELLATKTVQELLTEGELLVPPQKFILKDGIPLPNASVELMDVPVIDLGLLTPSSFSAEELDKLRSALTTGCCFHVINHGMTPEFLDKVREITKQFFAIPVEEKQKYLRPVDDIEGYGNDMVLSEQQTLDWTDRLYLTVYPPDQRRLEFWPENPKSFRDTLDQYTSKMQVITETVLKAMAWSLNLEEDCFLDKYGEKGKLDARFNFYPPCSRPDRILGFKPHADSSIITIVLQDKEVEGLQFLKDDQWFRAPIVPEALLINVGDQVEILTNGLFKSPVHKVVINGEKERISLVVFSFPDSETEIKPLESLINESRPRLYRKMKNYGDIFFEYYQQGIRPIEAAII